MAQVLLQHLTEGNEITVPPANRALTFLESGNICSADDLVIRILFSTHMSPSITDLGVSRLIQTDKGYNQGHFGIVDSQNGPKEKRAITTLISLL